MGTLEDAHLNANQYKWLSSIFYFGYMVAEWPQNWSLQRSYCRMVSWESYNIVCRADSFSPKAQGSGIDFYSGVITSLQIPCNNFASLFVVRFFLGLSEACIVPAFLLSMSMFFTRQEQPIMMSVMWFIGNSSPITSGFLSYGVLWIHTGSFHPRKWPMGTYTRSN